MVVQSINLVADLRHQNQNIGVLYIATGLVTGGDNNGGVFWWNPSSTAADDGVDVIQIIGTATGRWIRITDNNNSVPSSRTLTINGTTFDLSANRTYNVGTVTSVSFNLGASGTDLNSVVTNSTTTPSITLNVPTASAANRGALSAADWTTFNSKQAAGNYITALTGEVTASGPGSASATLLNSAVIGKVLTGLNLAGGGTIVNTDSILQAFGKTQNQITALVGGVMYEGVWNASTNNPAIVSSVGSKGDYYVVNVAGSTNIDGITDWKIGDWIIFNGTTWDKVDNTDAVSSVNGFTGAVSLTTANISEVTNLYYTEARVIANSDVAANTAARHNAVTLGTANGLTLSTQALSLALASGSTTGALSSADWSTFNNKQSTITLTTTSSSGASTFVSNTLNVPTYTLTGLGGVPSTRNITINGTTQDLSADRTFTIPTTNIYNSDGTLTGNRTVSAGGYTLTLSPKTIFNFTGSAGIPEQTTPLVGASFSQTFTATASNVLTYGVDISPTFNTAGGGYLTAAALRLGNSSGYAILQSNSSVVSLFNGRVDIGDASTSPIAKLEVLATLSRGIRVMGNDPSNGGVVIGSSLGNTFALIAGITSQTQNGFTFRNLTTSSDLYTIHNSGNTIFGGTTDAGYKLDVNGTARVSGGFRNADASFGIQTTIGTTPSNSWQSQIFFNGALQPNFFVRGGSNTFSGATSLSGSGILNAISASGTTGDIFAVSNGDIVGDNTNLRFVVRGNGEIQVANGAVINPSSRNYAAGGDITLSGGSPRSDVPNNIGGNVIIRGGLGTGTGASGDVIFGTATPTTSGTTLQTTTQRVKVFGNTGNVLIQNGGTFTDAGYKLDVNGTARVSNGMTLSGHTANNYLTIGAGAGSAYFGWSAFVLSVNGVKFRSEYLIGDPSGTATSVRADAAIDSRGYLVTDSIGVGTTTSAINASAIAQINSTTKGFLPPRMTTTQRNAISTPATGLQVYNSTTNTNDFYNGTAWGSEGTVTSVAALTLGTTGTDLSSTVANGTTTPVITLQVPTASATNRGALSSADWTTFNGKYNLPSLTSGSVLFSNGTTIAQDNANFFWDDANNRLGIGTNAPTGKLHIRVDTDSNVIFTGEFQYSLNNAGNAFTNYTLSTLQTVFATNGAERMRITSGGNVGIGTTSPSNKLTISANDVFNQDSSGQIVIRGATTSAKALLIGFETTSNYGYLQSIEQGTSARPLVFQPFAGNVGIGTTSPSYKTEVAGAIGNYWNGTAFTGTPLALAITNTSPGGYDPVLILQQTDSGGTSKNAGAIGMVGTGPWTAGNNGSQVSDMYFLVRNGSGGISERMRITSGGNVLIGTTTDNGSKFQVTGAATFSSSVTATSFNGTTNNIFSVSGTEGMRLTAAGLGIGNTTPGGDGGVVPRLAVSNPSNADKFVGIGYDNTGDYGFIHAIHRATAWKNLVIAGFGGNVGIGTTSPTQKLSVSGNSQINHAYTHAAGSYTSGLSSFADVTTGSSPSYTSGMFYGAFQSYYRNQFSANATIPNSAVQASQFNGSQITFVNSGTAITMTQASGIRAYASQILQFSFDNAQASCSVSHVAGIQIIAPYYQGANNPTITNYYGLILNDSTEYSASLTATNRWAIYQDGASDNNYFKGKVVIGSTNTVGVSPLNVKNLPTSSAGLSSGDIYSSAGVLMIV